MSLLPDLVTPLTMKPPVRPYSAVTPPRVIATSWMSSSEKFWNRSPKKGLVMLTPSYRYVLSCRPPPALGEPVEALFSATPGASWKVPAKVRPRGSFDIVSLGVTTDIWEDLVSTSGSSAVTSTDSLAVARTTGYTSVAVVRATTTSWSNA